MPAMQPGTTRSPLTYRFGNFELDTARFELRCRNAEVRLEKIPMELLLLLVERRGELVNRQEILSRLWGPNVFVDTEQGINTAIRKVRQTIAAADPGSPDVLQTVIGKGYRLAVPVEIVAPEAASPIRTAPPVRFQRWLAVFVVLLPLMAVSLYLLRQRSNHSISSVAVLPFENYSGDSTQEYVADGMTDAVITRVAQAEGLKVISRTSVMRLKHAPRDLPQIARELGVDAVLEGSIVRSGTRIRVTAQFINAHTDHHLWADEYDRDVSEILQVQDEIAQKIAASVKASIMTNPKSPTLIDPNAYDNYLRARSFAAQRTPASLAQAIALYQNVMDAQPQFSEAYSGLADAYAAEGYASFVSPQESFPKAKAAAQRALELDANSAEAHATLGYSLFYFDWNPAAAEREFEAALRANPNHALSHHWRSVMLTAEGKFSDAEHEITLARSLDPLSLPIDADIGFELYYAGRYDDAIRHLSQVVSIAPKFPPAHLWLGRAYEEKLNYPQAIAELERAAELVPDWSVTIAALGHARAISGDPTGARRELQHLQQLSENRFVTPYAFAVIHAGLGDKTNAFQWLDRAYQGRSHWLVWLPLDPRLANLRTDPRFQQLTATIRESASHR